MESNFVFANFWFLEEYIIVFLGHMKLYYDWYKKALINIVYYMSKQELDSCIEAVLDSKIVQGKTQYLVKWKHK